MKEKLFNKVLLPVLVVTVFLGVVSCSSEQSESPTQEKSQQDIVLFEPWPTPENPMEEEVQPKIVQEIPVAEGQEVADISLGRPEGMSSESWWLQLFEGATEPEALVPWPEKILQTWGSPLYSDTPQGYALDLIETAERKLFESLSAIQGDGTPSQMEGFFIAGSSAATAYMFSESEPPVYRVAILWGASKGPNGVPTLNRITELLFTGSPTQWTFLSCQQLLERNPGACQPILQSIL